MAITSAAVFILVGLATTFGSSDNGGAAPLSQVLVGIVATLVGIGCVVSMVKGYALTVAGSEVVAHSIRDRVVAYSEISSLEIVTRSVRMFQPGSCLCFHLLDGTDYVYKNFNAGLAPSSKGYGQLLEAKQLIEQRIADQRANASAPTPGRSASHSASDSTYEHPNGPRP